MKGAARQSAYMKVSVIIPSLNPDEKLISVVDSLVDKGFDDIIIVNDGSDEEHMWPFEKVGNKKQCTILSHEVNRGKGRGLKTAFEYCMANRQGIDGVVTVDGDNQHKADDIYNCCVHMMETESVVLGVRNFSQKDVPFKSRFGNRCTSLVFKAFCGLKISDTQTGLRAIPFKYLKTISEVVGERFEYETNMLLEFKKKNIPFSETEIKTVYIDENESTHFRPVRDSIKIYKVIFKYMAAGTGFKYLVSAILSWILDNALFNIAEFALLFMHEGLRILISTIFARISSSVFNYSVNKQIVFKSQKKAKCTLVRYYILWFFQMMISFGMVYLVTELLSLSVVMTGIAKIIIDMLLFLLSYQIQKRWVFRE